MHGSSIDCQAAWHTIRNPEAPPDALGSGQCVQEGDEIIDLRLFQQDRSNIYPRPQPLHFPPVVEGEKVGCCKPVRSRKDGVSRSPGGEGADRVEMVEHHVAQLTVRTVVAVGSRQGNIPEHRSSKPVGILVPVAFTHAPDIACVRIEGPGSSRTDMRQRQCMEFLVRKQSAVVAVATTGLAEEKLHAPGFLRVEGVGFAGKEAVIGAVETAEFRVHEV